MAIPCVQVLPDGFLECVPFFWRFAQQSMDETSLDTLRSWLGMYEEARYIASLDSDEPELKEFNTLYYESIRRGFGLKEIKGV